MKTIVKLHRNALAFLILLLAMMCNTLLHAQVPTITSFTPSSGSVGTLVTVTGTNVGNPTAFSIGGANAIVISNTGTKLVGMVMPGAAAGNISITSTGGTVNSSSNFTVNLTPYPSEQQGAKLVGTGAVGRSFQGTAVSISADGSTAIVGGYLDNSNAGAVWIYTRLGKLWAQQGTKLVGTGTAANSYFGHYVSISADGNTAIVGGAGVWVFARSGGVWTQQGPMLANSGTVSISADGNTAIVGSSGDNSGVGAAWIYTRSGGVWTQQGTKLVGTGAVGTALQGDAVSISADGNTAIVGGLHDNNYQGASWIFTRTGGVWTQQGPKLIGTGFGAADARQGWSVSISADGNTAIVGGPFGNNQIGAAWAFIRSGGVWTQQGAELKVTAGTPGESTGKRATSVSISADGNTVLVGGPGDTYGGVRVGEAIILTRSGGVWTRQSAKLLGSGAVGDSEQGWSVSISSDGSTAISGGPRDNSLAGAAWVFTICTPTKSTKRLSICPSELPYYWNNQIFTEAGTKTQTGFVNAKGCDSSATLILTVKSNTSSNTNLSICASQLPYSWNGLTFTSQGSQTKTGLTNAAGCDSSATLNLTVLASITPSVVINVTPFPVCADKSTMLTTVLTNGGSSPTYQWVKNGVDINGANDSVYSYVPSNNDIITCRIVSNATCVTGGTSVISNPTLVASGLGNIAGIARNQNGEFLLSGYSDNNILKVTNSGIISVFANTGLYKPNGVAVDKDGNLFVANYATISKITNSGIVSSFLSFGFLNGSALAIDTSGYLYVASGNNTILKVNIACCGPSTFVSSGINNPQGLAFDASSNLYISNYGNNSISKVSTSGVVSAFVTSDINLPYGLVFDKQNNLYVGNYLQSSISKISPNGTVNAFINSGIGQPTGLVFDEFGNLWVATWGGSLYKVSFLSQIISNPITFKVIQPTSSTKNLTICPSQLPYSWNGLTFTTGGRQTKTGLTNASGCDSSATLVLSIRPATTVSFTILAPVYNIAATAVVLTSSPTGGAFSGSGISGNVFTPSVAGAGGPYSIKYAYIDSFGCTNTATQQTIVANCNVTATPGVITTTGGTAAVCPGSTKTYSIAAVAGATSYTWTPPTGGTILTGQGSTQVTINYTTAFIASGLLKVVANNACGFSTARSLTITRNTPATPGLITGLFYSVCNTSGVSYAVTNVTGNTFNWSFNNGNAVVASGQGSNSIAANFLPAYVTGVLSVTARNACGISAGRTTTIRATPAAPTTITGTATVCANQSAVAYSITSLSGVTNYYWVSPSGSHISDGTTTSTSTALTTTANSVTVNFGAIAGNISVRANNSCGAGTYKSLPVTISCLAKEGMANKPVVEAREPFSISLSPNPASNEFLLKVQCSNNLPVGVRVMDAVGKIIYESKGNAGQSFRFGTDFPNGLYWINVRQGDKVKMLKMLKGR